MARLVGWKGSFQDIFTVIASALVMLPVAVMSFTVCAMVAVALTLVAAGLLAVTGVLPVVSGWSLWSWFPSWVWLVIGAASVFSGAHAYYWRKERTRAKGRGVL